MGVLGSIVQILRPAVLDRRHDLAARDLVAAQPVGDDDPRHVLQALEEFAEELLGGQRVSAWHQLPVRDPRDARPPDQCNSASGRRLRIPKIEEAVSINAGEASVSFNSLNTGGNRALSVT